MDGLEIRFNNLTLGHYIDGVYPSGSHAVLNPSLPVHSLLDTDWNLFIKNGKLYQTSFC